MSGLGFWKAGFRHRWPARDDLTASSSRGREAAPAAGSGFRGSRAQLVLAGSAESAPRRQMFPESQPDSEFPGRRSGAGASGGQAGWLRPPEARFPIGVVRGARQRREGDSGNSGAGVGDPTPRRARRGEHVPGASGGLRAHDQPRLDWATRTLQAHKIQLGLLIPVPCHHYTVTAYTHPDTWGPGHGSSDRSGSAVWRSGWWAGRTWLPASRLPPPTPSSASPSPGGHRFPAASRWEVPPPAGPVTWRNPPPWGPIPACPATRCAVLIR